MKTTNQVLELVAAMERAKAQKSTDEETHRAKILHDICEKIHLLMLEAQNTHHLSAELVLTTAIGAIGIAARLSMPENGHNPTLQAMAIATLIEALVNGFQLNFPTEK